MCAILESLIVLYCEMEGVPARESNITQLGHYTVTHDISIYYGIEDTIIRFYTYYIENFS